MRRKGELPPETTRKSSATVRTKANIDQPEVALPGSQLSIADAMKKDVAFVAVCEDTKNAG